MSQQDYFITEEIWRHEKAFAAALAGFGEAVIINAGQEEACLLSRIVCGLTNTTLIAQDTVDIEASERCRILSDYREYRHTPGVKTLFILFKNRRMDTEYVMAQLAFFAQYLDGKNRFLYISESYIDNFKWDSYFEVSEEEYALLMQKQPDGSEAKQDFELDKQCAALSAREANITALRYSNLFGASVRSGGNEITRICKAAAETGEIVFREDDRNSVKSYTFIRDLLTAVGRMIDGPGKGRTHYVYNINSFILSPYGIKTALSAAVPKLRPLFPGAIPLGEEKFSILQRAKINQFLPSKRELLERVLEQAYYSILDNKEFDEAFEKDYNRRTCGKIEIVRRLEVDIWREIDRICKKHGIKYFLVGGSVLGAVRHRGFIPWDDDMDLAMLREDYERFRKIAPRELDARYYYQSNRNRDGSHNVFDKIRVRDTLFSTKFSVFQHRAAYDGVFMDVFVYDKTSNHRLLRDMHIKLILILKRVISIKWNSRINKKIHYFLSRFAFPLIMLTPFPLIHFMFERVVKLYRHSRKAKYLIDSTGLNVKKVGGFPAAWFDQLAAAVFEGEEVPVPAAYDEYLKRWYGENYMDLLPPAKRAAHKIAEINVGPYAAQPAWEEAL